MKSIIKKMLYKLGYNIKKVSKVNELSLTPYTKINLASQKVIDVDCLSNLCIRIPGMISSKSGKFLYTLCYMQQLKGDVVEIGSWQGRSTSFLASAVKNSRNGTFYAIDHFRGNVGKEKLYVVNKQDLMDLKSIFNKNMKMLGLSNVVNLLDMPNEKAIHEFKNKNIRFLFIDGDHTKEGVEKDIKLFFPKLMKDSIVVFDDFSDSFPGLISAIDNLLATEKFSKIMAYENTLVLLV